MNPALRPSRQRSRRACAAWPTAGELLTDDPLTAASDFNWLVVSKPQNMVMFGVVDAFTPTEIEEFVTSAVRVFLSAYRPGLLADSDDSGGDTCD